MTTPNHPTGQPAMPYQRYLNATHAARDQYLATTYHAHRMYLTGPWPDRETYQQVENTAWHVYYQAARTAWQRYTDELTQPETPPTTPHDPAFTPIKPPWAVGYESRTPRAETAGHWPPRTTDDTYSGGLVTGPPATEHQEGN